MKEQVQTMGSYSFRLLAIGVVSSMLTACASLQTSQVSVDYYNISGNSTAALDQQIRLKGPKIDGGKHAVAVARIKMLPNIAYSAGRNTCSITRAKVPVDAKVTLPRWTGRHKASKNLGDAWDNIDRYTRLHEATHVAIAFRFAKQIENDVLALPPARNCATLREKAKVIIDKHLLDHDSRQKEFDSDEQKRFAKIARETGPANGS